MKNFTQFLESRQNRLDKRTISQINALFIANGLGGNGRFPSIAAANNKIAEILNQFGVEIEDMMTGFLGPEGRKNFNLRFASTGDPFTPGPQIDNTMLVMAWYQTQTGFEIVCYMS